MVGIEVNLGKKKKREREDIHFSRAQGNKGRDKVDNYRNKYWFPLVREKKLKEHFFRGAQPNNVIRARKADKLWKSETQKE